jgi:glucose/mannose-6-phosphate isomerase
MTADRLDDVALLDAADPGGMLRQVASSAAQVREAVAATTEADLSTVTAGGRPRAVVVTGMGGSGVAGEVLAAVCGPGCPVQVAVVHDYRLPGWVGAADLVISVSCSGGTEETLSATAEAVRRGCRLIGVGGSGSPLATMAEQASAPFVPVRSAGMPRSTLWGLSVPLLVIAARLGIADLAEDAYESAAGELERVSHLCRPDSESFVNPGKSLALDLAGTLPMVWGTSPLTAVAAYRFGCQLNENGKYPAVSGTLPEANHNQVVTFDGPFAAGHAARSGAPTALDRELGLAPAADGDDGLDADPGLAGEPGLPGETLPLRLVLLRDTHEHPQVTRRREESARLAADRGISVTELAAEGDQPLSRLASLVQLIDYASVYLGIACGVDPGPVEVIGELKARIAQE